MLGSELKLMVPDPADSKVRIVPSMTSETTFPDLLTAIPSIKKLAFLAAWVSVKTTILSLVVLVWIPVPKR